MSCSPNSRSRSFLTELPTALLVGLIRVIFFLSPSLAIRISRLARVVFSSRLNQVFFLKACCGLARLRKAEVETSFFSVRIFLPIKTRLHLSDYTQADAFFAGLPPVCITLMESVRNNSLFFDIGANLGFVSIAMSRLMPGHSIFAFEANPEIFLRLQSNFLANCPEARAFQLALSNQKGQSSLLTISNDSGSSSLQADRFGFGPTWHDQKVRTKSVPINTETFSSWIYHHAEKQAEQSSCLIFKIDVEGHEKQVLEGMRDYLARIRSQELVFVVEVENEKTSSIRSFFSQLGFSEHRPCWNPDLKEFPHHTDLVFRRPQGFSHPS